MNTSIFKSLLIFFNYSKESDIGKIKVIYYKLARKAPTSIEAETKKHPDKTKALNLLIAAEALANKGRSKFPIQNFTEIITSQDSVKFCES